LSQFQDTTAEDSMVVQFILSARMGYRELESDEEDANAFEVPRDQLSKYIPKNAGMKSEIQKREARAAARSEELAVAKAEEAAKMEAAAGAEVKTETTVKVDVETKKAGETAMEVDGAEKPAEVKAETNGPEKETAEEEVKGKSEETKMEESPAVENKEEKAEEEVEKKPEIKETPPTATSEPAVESPVIKKSKKSEIVASVIQVEEFLVKFKNFSYLHCQWLTEEELLRGDKRIGQKVKRFKQKREKTGNVLEFCEEDPFNPDYVEVDRVLDASEHTDEVTNVVTKHYLVKWRSLPYEDCTWEVENDVDPIKIEEFMKWRYPPAEEMFYKKRPRKAELQLRHPRSLLGHRSSLHNSQLAARVRALVRHERDRVSRKSDESKHVGRVRDVLQGRQRREAEERVQVPRSHHHLRVSHSRHSRLVRDSMACMRHRRSPPSEEQQVQTSRGPQLASVREQTSSLRNSAPEQHPGTLLVAKLPRADPV